MRCRLREQRNSQVRDLRTRRLKKLQVIVELIRTINKLTPLVPKKRKKRAKKHQLPYHKRRRRVNWQQWVRELGPEDFYRHHRMTRPTFEKLLLLVRSRIERDSRKSRYGRGPVTPRMQLTITLKHLAGDSSHDIEKHMGGMYMLMLAISLVNFSYLSTLSEQLRELQSARRLIECCRQWWTTWAWNRFPWTIPKNWKNWQQASDKSLVGSCFVMSLVLLTGIYCGSVVLPYIMNRTRKNTFVVNNSTLSIVKSAAMSTDA